MVAPADRPVPHRATHTSTPPAVPDPAQPPAVPPPPPKAHPASEHWPPPGESPDGLIPQTPIVAKRSYAAPTSYVGSARRIAAWIKRSGASSPLAAGLAWTGGILAILLAWILVTVWYSVTVLLFGVFMIPYRLIRRGERKREHLQAVQLATMQAMMVNQQRALNQQGPPE